MRLPEKFEDRMKKMLGDEYDDFIKSMGRNSDIYGNTNKYFKSRCKRRSNQGIW